jgi:hypothetical protein
MKILRQRQETRRMFSFLSMIGKYLHKSQNSFARDALVRFREAFSHLQAGFGSTLM